MIRIPFRRALLALVSAVLLGGAGAPFLYASQTASVSKALAQAVATDTATPAPSATTAATQTPVIWTATPAPATQTPYILIATAAPATPTDAPTATALPPGYAPDACHPNHSLQQPCALSNETNVANLNFVSGGTDVYSFLLKGGRQYQLSATVTTDGIDPSMTVYLAGVIEQPLGQNDDVRIGDPSAVVTLTVAADAWYLVEVINKAPGDVRGKTYAISARSAGVPSVSTPSGAGRASTATEEDVIGNAYDVPHAARIVWAAPYDLSMVCPDLRPGACYAGRHTFTLVHVKAGIPLAALTYDLGAGVDTVLTMYKPDPTQTQESPGVLPGWRAIAANDDFVAGETLRSQVRVTPDWNGDLLLVVAPSSRQDLPPAPADSRPGRYRLMVGPPEMKAVAAAMAAQGDMPTAMPAHAAEAAGGSVPAPSGASVAAAAPAAPEASITGIAELTQQTDLYGAVPPQPGDRLRSYAAGTLVKLLGQSYRGWVKVQPADAVMVGWMWGPSLKAVEVAGGLPPGAHPTTTGSGSDETATAVGAAPAANGGGGLSATPIPFNRAATIEQLDPEPLLASDPARPVARALRIEVCTAALKDQRACGTALAGLRVEVRLASTLAIQVQGVTDAEGKVTLSTSVPPGTRLVLSIPVLGMQAAIANEATELPVRVPATLGEAQ
jgi:hypothetical protein